VGNPCAPGYGAAFHCGGPVPALSFLFFAGTPITLYVLKKREEKIQARVETAEEMVKVDVAKAQYPLFFEPPVLNIESRVREAQIAIWRGYFISKAPELFFQLSATLLRLVPLAAVVSPAIDLFDAASHAYDEPSPYSFVRPEHHPSASFIVNMFGWLFLMFALVGLAFLVFTRWVYRRVALGTNQPTHVRTTTEFLPHLSAGELWIRPIRSIRFVALEHCSIYEDEFIIREMVGWMTRKEEAAPPKALARAVGSILGL
jgi:hypothetical protein